MAKNNGLKVFVLTNCNDSEISRYMKAVHEVFFKAEPIRLIKVKQNLNKIACESHATLFYFSFSFIALVGAALGTSSSDLVSILHLVQQQKFL